MAQSPWQPHKGQPLPTPSAWRVTDQLEQGAVTCSLLWLQLWGERSQAGDTIHRQGPNKIHLQTNTMSQGPAGHVCSPSSTFPTLHYMWHLLSRTVSSDTSEEWAVQTTPPRGLWAHIKRRQVDCPALVCVGDLHHLSHIQLCYNPLKSASLGKACDNSVKYTSWRRSRRAKNLISAMMTSSVAESLFFSP